MNAHARVTRNGQVTIPKELRDALKIDVGDFVEWKQTPHGLLLEPKKLVASEQAYFWTDDWQQGEREAEDDIKEGRVYAPKANESPGEALDRLAKEVD